MSCHVMTCPWCAVLFCFTGATHPLQQDPARRLLRDPHWLDSNDLHRQSLAGPTAGPVSGRALPKVISDHLACWFLGSTTATGARHLMGTQPLRGRKLPRLINANRAAPPAGRHLLGTFIMGRKLPRITCKSTICG
jgi:hypothetical protein